MALNKLKFSSINVTPVANQAIKFNSRANGFETGSAGGAMTFIKKLTALPILSTFTSNSLWPTNLASSPYNFTLRNITIPPSCAF